MSDYPKHITPEVIENSKIIHELGGRVEVEPGDYMIDESAGIHLLARKVGDGGAGVFYPRNFIALISDFIPIWDSRKCKEWLRGKGYSRYSIYIFNAGEVRFQPINDATLKVPEFEAPIEDEACQKAVIKVLREEK